MNKTLLVLKYELLTVLRSRSFLFTAFALPLIGALIFLGISVVKGNDAQDPSAEAEAQEMPELQVEGYVDLAGFIQEVQPEVPAGILVPYADEQSAKAALEAGEITAYYLIPADYVAQGDLIYIKPDFQLISQSDQSWTMQQTVFRNLLGNDDELVNRVWPAMELEETPLRPELVNKAPDSPIAFYLPYATMMIFYFVLIMSASLLLNSVGNEKKNRTLEVLLISVSPRQLLGGKIIGLGLLGLLQMVIWVGTGYTLLQLSGRTFDVPVEMIPPASFLIWALLFFLLGYAVYASLMAGLGALVPNIKEANQSIILVIWPMLIPLLLIVSLIEKTHQPLAVGLSLFPLTSPLAMIARLAVGGVAWWHPPLALILLAATAVLVVRSVARMFRTQTMLTGQPFSAKRFVAALLGRF